MASVEFIYIAPTRGAPMLSLDWVEAIEGVGLAGDQYSNTKNPSIEANQITLIEKENIDAFVVDTGEVFTPDMPRRNIVTVGIRLNDLCGKRFKVGNVVLEGIELCDPCKIFSKRTYQSALKFFVGKGGLRAKIVGGGKIRINDPIIEIM